MINLVRPKFFIPVHGDYRHLKRHASWPQEPGVVEKTILLEDGDVLEFDKSSATKTGKVTVGRVCIDSGGSASDVVEDIVIRDRKHLSEDGIVIPIIAINKRTGRSSDEERRDYGVMKDKIRGDLKRFLQKNANRRPLIMPIILEL
jgi:ribonuclease J